MFEIACPECTSPLYCPECNAPKCYLNCYEADKDGIERAIFDYICGTRVIYRKIAANKWKPDWVMCGRKNS